MLALAEPWWLCHSDAPGKSRSWCLTKRPGTDEKGCENSVQALGGMRRRRITVRCLKINARGKHPFQIHPVFRCWDVGIFLRVPLGASTGNTEEAGMTMQQPPQHHEHKPKLADNLVHWVGISSCHSNDVLSCHACMHVMNLCHFQWCHRLTEIWSNFFAQQNIFWNSLEYPNTDFGALWSK